MATTHPAEHLRLILRQVPGAIWATDTELRLTYVHGVPPMLDDERSTRLIGTTIYDFVHSHAPTEPLVAHHLAALSRRIKMDAAWSLPRLPLTVGSNGPSR